MEIEIRKYRKEHIPSFYAAIRESIEEVSKWLPWCDEGYSILDTENWINVKVPEIWNSQKGCEFIVVDPLNDKVLGGYCLERINNETKEANIGYWAGLQKLIKELQHLPANF